jgi:NAD+ diphosphatase
MPFASAVVRSGAASERALWFVVHPRGLVVRREGEGVTLPSADDVATWPLETSPAHYLGRLDDQDCFAITMAAEPSGPFAVQSLRALHGLVAEDVFAIAGRATQITKWAEDHRFCGRCGKPTERHAAERCMHCPSCGLDAYPRISPAIIVLVRRGEEALLARSGRFPLPFFSTLAGFAEVGESLEETLAREVREEVGVEVTSPRYFASQPWPFPHSLMIGFFADWAAGEIRVDGEEIAEAAWFRPESLPMIPPKLSIARRLIDAWIAEIRP